MASSIPTPMFASSITLTQIQIQTATHKAVYARQVITQTITYADYTTTALVTLGPGDPTAVPPPQPPTSGSQGSDVPTSRDIGIIIGSILGTVVLGLIIWMCVVARRRRLAYRYEYEEEDDIIYTYDEVRQVQQPQRSYWPPFPKSIPPPVVPTYVATPRPRQYTSNNATRRSYYGGRGWS
ncbi:hypothetical protein GGS20DRAFT_366484 [Poronia punctata]|nr:hypothetical protein GGS20DRAFT_366484 [Poronia punctata]